MKNRKKNRNIPDHIILNILNQAASAESDVLDHYDEDLAQELRLALSQALPALRETLIKNHLEKRPVIVVLGHLTD